MRCVTANISRKAARRRRACVVQRVYDISGCPNAYCSRVARCASQMSGNTFRQRDIPAVDADATGPFSRQKVLCPASGCGHVLQRQHVPAHFANQHPLDTLLVGGQDNAARGNAANGTKDVRTFFARAQAGTGASASCQLRKVSNLTASCARRPIYC